MANPFLVFLKCGEKFTKYLIVPLPFTCLRDKPWKMFMLSHYLIYTGVFLWQSVFPFKSSVIYALNVHQPLDQWIKEQVIGSVGTLSLYESRIKQFLYDEIISCFEHWSMRGKCPNTKFFLVSIFPYSDWIRENAVQEKLIWKLFT